MSLVLPRRRFLTGLAGAGLILAAPSIVRASSLMPLPRRPASDDEYQRMLLICAQEFDRFVSMNIRDIEEFDGGWRDRLAALVIECVHNAGAGGGILGAIS